MNEIKLLTRSLVRTYYESNIGFFLVVLYLAFGLMRSTEHIAIASSIAASWPLTFATLLLWLLYGFKTTAFVYKTLQTKAYRVLRELALFTPGQQWKGLTIVHLLVLAPAWFYGLFITYFNLQYETYDRLVVMLLFLALLTLTSTRVTTYSIHRPVWERSLGIWYQLISKRFALPYKLWYIRFLFVAEPIPTFLAKTGSLLMLMGTFYLFNSDTYDWRLLAIGSLFAYAFNSMLVYGLFHFKIKNEWTFGLPVKRGHMLVSMLSTLSFLFIPEIIVIAANAFSSTSPFVIINLYLFMIAFAFFWISMLLRFPITREVYGKRTFYLTLLMVFIIMYSTPLWLTNILFLALGAWGIYGVYRLKWSS